MSEREREDLCPGADPRDLPLLLTDAIGYWSNNKQSLLPDLAQIQNLHLEMFTGYLTEGVPGELKVSANFVLSERGIVHFTSPAHVESDYHKLYQQAQALIEKLNLPPDQPPEHWPDPGNDGHWPSDDNHQAWIDRAHYIAYFHAHFIHIHPFANGNGRVARLIAWEQARRLFRNVCREGYDWTVVNDKENPFFQYAENYANVKHLYKDAMSKFDFLNINYHLFMCYFMFQPGVRLPHFVSLPAFKPTYHYGQISSGNRPGNPVPPRTE
jgi:hypothetical protein